jgi:methylphosphotriester-DNA--protein-cysteine methyltransferase
MTFESWRRQIRLIKGIHLLVEACHVKEAATNVGYRQSSAFVQLFRQTVMTRFSELGNARTAKVVRTESTGIAGTPLSGRALTSHF